jgi:hypothetical protein
VQHDLGSQVPFHHQGDFAQEEMKAMEDQYGLIKSDPANEKDRSAQCRDCFIHYLHDEENKAGPVPGGFSQETKAPDKLCSRVCQEWVCGQAKALERQLQIALQGLISERRSLKQLQTFCPKQTHLAHHPGHGRPRFKVLKEIQLTSEKPSPS